MDERSDQAEFRLVTILFADIVGSTAMAEGQDAETTRLVLDRCLRLLNQAVNRYGGTVARLAGDGLLAFFGAPKAHEDDPERAALAALEMHQAIRHYGEELQRELSVRVGINTGRVVMGDVGDEVASEYTAMGPPIHLAARLQSAAEPGTTLIGETTCRLIRHRFETEAAGKHEFKGFDEPQPTFQLVRALPEPHQERGRGEGAGTPFVGRDRELSDLSRTVDELEQGRGAIVALIGEPGVGKSRLLHELQKARESAQITWAEGRAYSYTQDQPHGVIRDLLQELFGLSSDDTPAMTDLKLERALMPILEDDIDQVWPYLASLLGAPQPPSSSQDLDSLDPEALSRKMSEAFVRTIEAMASQHPMALSFDDLHWADPSSLDWIRSLFLSTERVPLVLILMFRPETEKKVWDLKAAAEREFGHRFLPIRLQPLGEQETETLIQRLLPADSSPGQQAVVDQVRARAEGNPFYVEELVRSLVEPTEGEGGTGQSASHLNVPETLQEVVQARIDRLPAAERSALQAAAVIGRRFAYPVLEALIAPEDSLQERILHLQRADLIRERARIPHPEYIFKHSIVHELAYHSVVAEKRTALHRRAGEILEQVYADRLSDEAGMIAHHYLEAGEDRKAFQFERMAGDNAYRVFANQEAAEHYDRAVALADRLGIDPDEFTDLCLRAGRAHELASQHDAAVGIYAHLAEIAERTGDDRMLLASNMARITLMVTPTQLMDRETARGLIDESMALAKAQGDRAAEAKLYWNKGLLARFQGDGPRSVEYGEESLKIAEELGLEEQIGFTLTDLFWSYMLEGQLDKCRVTVKRAQRTWQDLNNLPMYTDSLSSSSALYYLIGEYQQAIDAASKAWDIADEIGNLWAKSFSCLFAPMALLDTGEVGRALDQMQKSLQLAERAGFWIPQVFLPAVMAATHGQFGQPEVGQEILAGVPDHVPNAMPFAPEFLAAVRAYLSVLLGEWDRTKPIPEIAESGTTALLASVWPTAQAEGEMRAYYGDYEGMKELAGGRADWARQGGIHSHLMEALLVMGNADLELGQPDQAAAAFEEAIELATQLGHHRLTWQLLAGLYQAKQVLHDDAAALEARNRARQEIDLLVGKLGTDELRQSFTSLPLVHNIMSGEGSS